MGLDMNLYGRKLLSWSNKQFEDNFRISKVVLELAYWRKHPDYAGMSLMEAFKHLLRKKNIA